MDCRDYIIVAPERKRGQHLGCEERGTIQQLKSKDTPLEQLPKQSTVHQAPS